MKANKTRNELKVSDSKNYPLKNEERMKNDGKPSRIRSRKRLGSVTEAPRLGFSSWKLGYDTWEGYIDIVVPRKILPERNVVIYHTEFDEFKEQLERRKWDEELTSFDGGSIDVPL